MATSNGASYAPAHADEEHAKLNPTISSFLSQVSMSGRANHWHIAGHITVLGYFFGEFLLLRPSGYIRWHQVRVRHGMLHPLDRRSRSLRRIFLYGLLRSLQGVALPDRGFDVGRGNLSIGEKSASCDQSVRERVAEKPLEYACQFPEHG